MFKSKVIEVVRLIPRGKVASYGQIAAYAGMPRAARQVGWILREMGDTENVPWWRVINQKGRISIDGNLHADRNLQKKLLESEGIKVINFEVDMGQYRFVADQKLLKKLQLPDLYIEGIISTYNL